MNIQDADDGRADFLSGKKDEARYNDASNGADYRRGWQLARLGAVAAQPKPEARPWTPPPSDDPPWDDAPRLSRETGQRQPAELATPPAPEPPAPTREDVKLARGEDAPAKPARRSAGQIDLFG